MPDDAQDIVCLKLCTLSCAQSPLVENLCKVIAACALVGRLLKDFPHPDRLVLIDFKVFHGLFPLVNAAFLYNPVSIRHEATGVVSA